MSEITFEQFVKTLDKKHPWHEALVMSVRVFHEKVEPMRFARKGRDLVEIMKEFGRAKLHPVVDKKLGMVFGVKSHLGIRVDLYRYHRMKVDPNMGWINPHKCADDWVAEGMGYFVSSMMPDTVLVADSYVQDRFDKDVFLVYRVDHSTPMP